MGSYIRKFARSTRGNVGMMFGFLLLPLLVCGGMAIDLGRRADAKSTVQEAADMALLRVARMKTMDPKLNDAELTARARKLFDAATGKIGGLKLTEFAVRYDVKNDSFSLDIAAAMPTAIMSIAGVPSLGLETISGVKLGKPPYMEVALVLDNTGSMNDDGKLDAMKDAATTLVESLFVDAHGQVRVALVPFSQYVNVGSQGHGKFWMKDSGADERGRGVRDEPDNSSPSTSTSPSTSGTSGSGSSGSGSSGSGSGSSGSGSTKGGKSSKGSSGKSSSVASWEGCVGSRDYPANTDDTGFFEKPAPEVYDGLCPNEIQPLTKSKPKVLGQIEAMEARGSTYIAGGLEWGWHVLTNNSPFREGVSKERLEELGGIKAMVVLTDGDNTIAPTYPEHESTDRTLANTLTSRLCTEIKEDGILVYTIAFGKVAASTKDLLEDCAATPSHYFSAANSDELAAAFNAIASSMRMLSLSK